LLPPAPLHAHFHAREVTAGQPQAEPIGRPQCWHRSSSPIFVFGVVKHRERKRVILLVSVPQKSPHGLWVSCRGVRVRGIPPAPRSLRKKEFACSAMSSDRFLILRRTSQTSILLMTKHAICEADLHDQVPPPRVCPHGCLTPSWGRTGITGVALDRFVCCA